MDSFQALCYLVTCQHFIPISTLCFLKHSFFGCLGQPPLGFPVLTLRPSPDSLGPLETCMHACPVIQSCLTLCDFMDCSPPGSSVHGIFQARILEWVAISHLQGIFLTQGSKKLLLWLLPWQADSFTTEPPGKPFETFDVIQPLSHVQLFATPWTVACQASLSFSISWSLLKLMSTE